MKRILTLALFFLTAGVVKSEAPLSGTLLSDLQAVVTANKTLIETQAKTLETLIQLDQDAQQLKAFGKRG